VATATTASLPEVLTTWRARHQLGVHEAAGRIGVQPRTWLSWEDGAAPSLCTVPDLARALDVPCTELLELLPDRLPGPEPGPGEIASALRSWRRRDAMSLGRAARRLGVSPSTVLDWEAGRRPRAAQLDKLIAAGVLCR
jgi:transcriptional regulator with XRE-family HTH domain